MTVAQEAELRAWLRVHGSVGPDRWDHYVQMLCMYAGRPWPAGQDVDTSRFPMPWHRSAQPAQDDGRPRPGPIVPRPVPSQSTNNGVGVAAGGE